MVPRPQIQIHNLPPLAHTRRRRAHTPSWQPSPPHNPTPLAAVRPRAARDPDAASSQPPEKFVAHTYQTDGPPKATIEDVFSRVSQLEGPGQTPWHVGFQRHERDILWNSALKAKLIERAAAQAGGMCAQEMDSHMRRLLDVLPDLEQRLDSIQADLLLTLVTNVDRIAVRLVQLKSVFPKADCGRLLAREPNLVRWPAELVVERAAQLKALLPNTNVDLLVQDHPSVLDVETLEEALKDVQRLMPGTDPENFLRSKPESVLELQKGANMIPYDAIPDNPWGHK